MSPETKKILDGLQEIIDKPREHIASLQAEVDRLRAEVSLEKERKLDAVDRLKTARLALAAAKDEAEKAKAELSETKDDKAYSDAKLTEHAEAVGVNPDHIDYIDETTKAIIQMWADNSKLKATNAEQFRLYCEETKKHNETAAQLVTLAAEVESLRASTQWRDGAPDVPEGKQRRYLVSANSGKWVGILLYSNKYWAPCSDDAEPPEGAEVNDDGDVCWSGWCEESCDQCDTFWSWSGTVDAWMPLPAARAPAAPANGRANQP